MRSHHLQLWKIDNCGQIKTQFENQRMASEKTSANTRPLRGLGIADRGPRLVGKFYVGCDLGKRVDNSAVAVVKKQGEVIKLVHVKRFPLETPLATVLGYLKLLTGKLRHIQRTIIDQTGMGEFVVEEAKNVEIANVEGVILTLKLKEEMMSFLKNVMERGLLRIPYEPTLIAEFNLEKYELTKDGHIRFYHQAGTHDDQLWAVAMAVWAAQHGSGAGFFAIPR